MRIGDKINHCSACGACEQICPKNAVELKENDRGFLYPVIDEEKCINCGICVKVCECYSETPKADKLNVYAVRHKDLEQQMNSRSGGLFTALAEVVLDRSGVCYGAAVCGDLVVRQTRITEKSELYKLQGSKYVQSSVEESFKEVEKDLKKGLLVLYSGTSCAVDGLKRYLTQKKADTSKLVTCDLICHGVPSPLMYRENLKRLEKQNGSGITDVDFRNKKKYGWTAHVETYRFQNGEELDEAFYTDLFIPIPLSESVVTTVFT